MSNLTIEFKAKERLGSYPIGHEALQKEVAAVADTIDQKIQKLNELLALNNVPLYRSNKQLLCRFIETKHEVLSRQADRLACEQSDTNALNRFFESVGFHLMRYNPPLKEESEKEKQENMQKEAALRQEQQRLDKDDKFLQKLGKIKEQAGQREKYGIKVYFVYAWPETVYKEREGWVQAEFLPALYKHLEEAGIQPIWDKNDNVAGNNLSAFMGQILGEADYIVVFGTESLRSKLLQDTKAIGFEEKLLKLKWLSDLREDNIGLGKTTLIPYVITGTRETSFTNNFIIPNFQELTIRAWRTGSYEKIVLSLISQLYGVKDVLQWLDVEAKANTSSQLTISSRFALFPAATHSETVSANPGDTEEAITRNESRNALQTCAKFRYK